MKKLSVEERVARLRAIGLDFSDCEINLIRSGYGTGKLDYLEAKAKQTKSYDTVDYVKDPRTDSPVCLGSSDRAPIRRALLLLIAATATSQSKRIRDAAREATITLIDEHAKDQALLKKTGYAR